MRISILTPLIILLNCHIIYGQSSPKATHIDCKPIKDTMLISDFGGCLELIPPNKNVLVKSFEVQFHVSGLKLDPVKSVGSKISGSQFAMDKKTAKPQQFTIANIMMMDGTTMKDMNIYVVRKK